MTELPLAAYMFPFLLVLVFAGIPVAFSLIATAFLFGVMAFGITLPAQFHSRLFDVQSNFILVAIPLFIFMGAMLEKAGIAARLFEAIKIWFGPFRGGLAMTTIVLCGIFAASSGVVGAVEIVVGVMALPAMLGTGYRRDLAAGTVCAGGSLGTTIPPSIVIIVYASMTETSVGDLFAGILIPAAVMVSLFLLYVLIRCALQPDAGPGFHVAGNGYTLSEKCWLALTSLLPATLLILAVLGSIFAGIATPTEAAAVGALGSVLLSLAYRRFSFAVLFQTLSQTIRVTSMIMLIVLGGVLFASIFIVQGGDDLVSGIIHDHGFSQSEIILAFMLAVFLLGFVLDWISVLIIVLPIADPIIQSAGINPLWFGVMVCIILQTSYLTPPMAPSIFYLRSIAPREITYRDMYRGVTPYIGAQLLTLAMVACFPRTVTWLPEMLFGF
ncbi:MAG: TRAP transporter large permease subunit [Gammaproteobacteria bacterium]|nr:TRAP transporter large permease subunit [Gammaproteobacteria bacterium]